MGDVTFTAYFELSKFDLIITYKNESGKEIKAAVREEDAFTYDDIYRLADRVPASMDGTDGHHYVRVAPEDTALTGIVIGNVEINAVYAVDDLGGTDETPGDEIPDKYQVVVAYNTDGNGYVSAEKAETAVEVVTLYKGGEPAAGWALPGDPDAKGYTRAEGITATAKTEYTFVNWTWNSGNTIAATPSGVEVTDTITITAHFELSKFDLTITYKNESGKEIKEAVREEDAFTYGDVYRLADRVPASMDGTDGHHYVRVAPEDTALTGIVTGNVEINAVYAVDDLGGTEEDPGDGIPDKYQVVVTYDTDGNGYVTAEEAETATEVVTLYKDGEPAAGWALPGDPDAKGSTKAEGIVATAKDGYAFDKWVYEDGSCPDAVPADIPVTGEMTITAQFAADENGDNIPDKYQIIFTYKSENDATGKVTGTTYEVHTFYEDEEETTYATPSEISPNREIKVEAEKGFAFDHWYVDGDQERTDYTEAMDVLGAEKYSEDTTFVAVFSEDNKGGTDPEDPGDDIPDKYQIVFTYKSADPATGEVVGQTRQVYTSMKDNHYVELDPNGVQPSQVPEFTTIGVAPKDGYAFDFWTIENKQDTVKDYDSKMYNLGQEYFHEDTTFVAYFDVDKLHDTTKGDDPNQPDGVSDKYQVVFTYKTEDANHGTFNADSAVEVVEVHTMDRDENGYHTTEFKPLVNLTVNNVGSYRFDNWTNGTTTYNTDDDLRAAAFTSSQTFTAHFYRSGGNGGSGGGGSSSGGGNPYNPSTGGPGVTITDPEVPLAPLPDGSGDSTMIFDDNVPLAPLPKTGQQSSKTAITMLLAGIFLAFASLTKRREENN